MVATLLIALIWVQGAGALQPGTGIVTGSVQVAGGGSPAGVRVGAMAADDAAGADLLSVAETDGAGRYRLINVPAGRYYIVAGRLDNLTYYPGGNDRTKATEVVVEAARIASSVDFTVPAESKRPVPPSFSANAPFTPISPEQVRALAIASEGIAPAKLKLLLEFEKTFPKSSRLPELYVNVSRAHALQSDLPKAVQYAEKAVATTERMRNEPAPLPYTGTSWGSWVTNLDASAKSNLAWVKQMITWQRNELQSAILRRRR